MAKRSKKIPVNKWVEVLSLSDIEENIPKLIEYGEDRVLVHRSGEEITAVSAACTHHGGPLEDGLLIDHVLTCPKHGSRFDVSTGICQCPPAFKDLSLFETKTEGGTLLLRRKKLEPVSVILRKESGTFLIIGSGAAGTAAAVTLRREGFAGRLIMVTAETLLPYDRPQLSKDSLSGNLVGGTVFLQNEEYFNSRKIELLMGRQIAQVDPKNRQIVFMDDDFLLYDKLLLATGGIPRTPGIPGTDLRNFFLLRNLSDAESIAAAAGTAESVLIIGAGFIGLETAASLRERGLEVHVIAPEQVPLAGVFGRRIGERMMKIHEERGVKFHLGKSVVRLTGEGSVEGAELSDESTLKADMVVAGIGIIPAVHFFEDIGIVENTVIPVDEHMATGVEGIYAAGDNTLVRDFITGGMRHVEHWSEAMQQGQHAARCMMGSEEQYRGVPFFWSKQYDTVIRYAGNIPKIRKIRYLGDVEKGDFIAGYYRGNRLCAVSAVGKDREFMTLLQLLRSGRTLAKRDFKNGIGLP